eukprot:6462200-Amphidinium_carterae.1
MANNQESASLATPLLLSASALTSAVGLVQVIAGSVIDIVPPLIPPVRLPVWILMPLPCLPLVLAHNCLGVHMSSLDLHDPCSHA